MIEPRVIKTRALNRMLIYWIPALFLAYGVMDLLAVQSDGSAVEAAKSIGIAVVLVLFCEVFMFGFRITLFPDRLIYRYRAFPLKAEKVILRDTVTRSRVEAAIRADNKPWMFVEVETVVRGEASTHRINLTAFSRADIAEVLRWLPHMDEDSQR